MLCKKIYIVLDIALYIISIKLEAIREWHTTEGLHVHARIHFMRLVDLSKAHFSNGLHFTLLQYAPPDDAARAIEHGMEHDSICYQHQNHLLLTALVAGTTAVGSARDHARAKITQIRAALATGMAALVVARALVVAPRMLAGRWTAVGCFWRTNHVTSSHTQHKNTTTLTLTCCLSCSQQAANDQHCDQTNDE